MTTDINFNITGIENLIEDLKKTRCECDNKDCINNAAWKGRNQGCYAVRCLLPSVWIGEDGECNENSVEKRPKSEMVISPQAVEAAIKHLGLLKRVVDESVPLMSEPSQKTSSPIGMDDHLLKPELFEEIKQALGRDEE